VTVILELVALAVIWLSPFPDAGASPLAPTAAAPALTLEAVTAAWSAQALPAPGPAQVIGACSAGCLQGAESLVPSGPGYELLHLARRRTYGHPDLLAYLRRLGLAVRKRQVGPLIVGDLSQVRGGPTPSGHHSHQSGLDADLGYAPPRRMRPGRLRRRDRERLAPPAVVDLQTHEMMRPWGPRVVRLLALAAGDPAVDRIFVNPAIKRTLCAGPARGAPWLARLRPWWGHHDHFHVRLKCPADSPLCRPQDPVPEDDGCGPTLAWWFSPDAQAMLERREKADPKELPRAPALPPECAALLAPAPVPPSGVSASDRP
jgi:penicillin-insensitive murein endopeptidase